MNRTVFCAKLKENAEGLTKPPFKGPLGEKIYDNISKAAWGQWLTHQTMLINEYRLNLMEVQARDYLKEEMQKFFFGDGSEKPKMYQEEV